MRKKTVVIAVFVGLASFASYSEAAPDDCTLRTEADRRLDPIRGKLPKVVTAPTMQQLADHGKPTQQQRKALLAYDEVRSFCETQFGHQYTGETATVYSSFVMQSKKLRASLYSGVIDFATFVSTDQENAQAFLNNVDAIRLREENEQSSRDQAAYQQRQQQEMVEEQQEILERQQQQYEEERKQQELQNLSNSIRELGNSVRRNAPIMTNCYSSYGNTNCTTY